MVVTMPCSLPCTRSLGVSNCLFVTIHTRTVYWICVHTAFLSKEQLPHMPEASWLQHVE
jgi:hypothetical protein